MKSFASSARAPAVALGLAMVLMLPLSGCIDNPFVKKSKMPNPNAPKVTRVPLVTSTGRKAAVLSVHLRQEFPDACMYGITLTNNLDTKVTNIAVRLSAYILDGVKYDTITRNFYELRPTETQYREVTFTKVKCSEIRYIGVSDPGRCAVGQANRFTTAEGDCAKYIDVADTRLVELRKERFQPAVIVPPAPLP
jgi:hypothetical protein